MKQIFKRRDYNRNGQWIDYYVYANGEKVPYDVMCNIVNEIMIGDTNRRRLLIKTLI